MHIGIGLPTTVPGIDGRTIVDFSRAAEELGFSTLAVLDRLVYDSYDGLMTLTAAAAVTERINLATTILLAAYRPSPVLLAKQLATLDQLSHGRLVLGAAACLTPCSRRSRRSGPVGVGCPASGRGRPMVRFRFGSGGIRKWLCGARQSMRSVGSRRAVR